MKALRLVLLLMVNGMAISGYTQQTITAADELQQLYDLSLLPAYRSNTYSAQVSSYDTTGGNNDGFNGDYSFVRRNADSSLVILDVRGAGTINRIWTPTPNSDTLDFYIDDAAQPSLSVCFNDLFSGKVFPFVQPLCGNQLGGYYCYYPVLFQKHCVIITRGKKMLFYQVGYRLHQNGTRVQPFTTAGSNEVKIALGALERVWNTSPGKTAKGINASTGDGKTVETSIRIKPGETRKVFSCTQGGRITGLEITPAASVATLSKNLLLRVYWDDEPAPAIDCPVSDFFGFAFGRPSMQSMLIGTAGNTCYSWLPMPFDKEARVEIVYRADKHSSLPDLDIRTTITYTLQPRLAAKEGRFYAYRNSGVTTDGKPHVLLDVQGKGHYVGAVLQAQGLQTGMTVFFEGDDSTEIDQTLRFHGTGSEDYFNGGWYALLNRWDARMSLPLHGSLDYSLAFARTGGYRFYLSDKMSFEKHLFHSIEHGGERNAVPGIYTSISYFYCDRNPLSPAHYTTENTTVYLPDTISIYPQFASVVPGEDISIKTTWENHDIGQSFDITAGNNSLLKINLEDVPPGAYKLLVSYAVQPGGCMFSLWQRQTKISDDFSSRATATAVKEVEAGKITLTALNSSVTFRFTVTDQLKNFLWRKLILVKLKD